MSKKLRLKKDFVIPKGTEFECIDGNKTEWILGNYEANIALNNDNTMRIVVNTDTLPRDKFEVVKD
jgi:hypothetical protein